MKRTFTRGADTILLHYMYVYTRRALGYPTMVCLCICVCLHACTCARVHIDPERARIDNTGRERGTLRPFYEYRISGKQYSILEDPLGATIFTA